MGQYWELFNLAKKEKVCPHVLGCGLKLREQLGAYHGTGAALIVLCAAMPEARGGGDFDKANDPDGMIGRWAGDPIALLGDYSEDGDMDEKFKAGSVYADEEYTDISMSVAAVIEGELEGKFIGDGWRKFVRN